MWLVDILVEVVVLECWWRVSLVVEKVAAATGREFTLSGSPQTGCRDLLVPYHRSYHRNVTDLTYRSCYSGILRAEKLLGLNIRRL